MKYFSYLTGHDLDRLFFRPPEAFTKRTDPGLLRRAVGGLLYIPGSNPDIARILLDGKVPGLVSMAICLEDAVGDGERGASEDNVRRQLSALMAALVAGSLSPKRLPLLFVRVKDGEMLRRMSDCFAAASRVLTGVILPKISLATLDRALSLTDEISARAAEPFYAMPILESEELMLNGDRVSLLRELLAIMDSHPGRVLNVRVGATDLCGLYGVRRSVDTPIYSIPLVAGCISDVVRVFGLGDRYTVSGPVWEYYGGERELDGLWREVRLDLQNGILGKTCVHPSQLLPIQASYTVPFETYQDAAAVAGGDGDALGVLAGAGRNKMNELKPHALWARKILLQAGIYGVCRENTGPGDLLRAAGEAGCGLERDDLYAGLGPQAHLGAGREPVRAFARASLRCGGAPE